MELEGKKIVFLGDSITEGHCATSKEYRFTDVLCRDAKLAELYNHGIGGTRLSKQMNPSPDTVWDQDFISRVGELETGVDAVVVFGGTNDFGHGDLPFGKFGDTTEDTFCGCCHILMNMLVEKYPTVPVVVATPLHRTGENDIVNKFGFRRVAPLCAYVDIIRKTAEKFSLPVLDLYASAGMNPNVEAQNKYYFVDGLHPNNVGHARLARIFQKFLENVVD